MKPKVFSFLKLKDLVEVLREKKIQSHYWNGTSREMKVNYTGNTPRRTGLRLGREECSTAQGPNSDSQNPCANPNSKTTGAGTGESPGLAVYARLCHLLGPWRESPPQNLEWARMEPQLSDGLHQTDLYSSLWSILVFSFFYY